MLRLDLNRINKKFTKKTIKMIKFKKFVFKILRT